MALVRRVGLSAGLQVSCVPVVEEVRAPVAQRIERLPSKQRIAGSNPSWRTPSTVRDVPSAQARVSEAGD